MKRVTWPLAVLSIILLGCSPTTGTTASPVADPTASPAPTTADVVSPTPSATPDIVPVSMTFDGTSCSYSGPVVFLRDTTVAVAYKATGAAVDDLTMQPIAIVGAIADGTTRAVVEEAVANLPASKWPPKWASTTEYRPINFPEGVVYLTLTRNQYAALCLTAAESTNQAYLGAMLEVIDR